MSKPRLKVVAVAYQRLLNSRLPEKDISGGFFIGGVIMLKKQTILQVLGALIVFTFLFPPFYQVLPGGGIRDQGYSFILNPPADGHLVSINHGMLLTQWLGLSLLAGIALFLTSGIKSSNRGTLTQSECDGLVKKAEGEILVLAEKYEEGIISFVEFEKGRMAANKAIVDCQSSFLRPQS